MKADLAPAWRRRAAIFWAARSPREQGILRLAGVVLALAIAGQLLWQLEDARRRQLRKDINDRIPTTPRPPDDPPAPARRPRKRLKTYEEDE